MARSLDIEEGWVRISVLSLFFQSYLKKGDPPFLSLGFLLQKMGAMKPPSRFCEAPM